MSHRYVIYVTIFLFGLLLSSSSFTAQSQSSLEKIKFTRIDVNDGLSNSNVTCILQDSKGFLWVGTTDGLNKYDGYGFTVYRQIIGDTTGLLTNAISCIFEDSESKLWVSTRNGGFYFYDRKKDRFVIIPALSANGEIHSISEDGQKTVWVTGLMNGKAFIANLNRVTNAWELHYLFTSADAALDIIQDTLDEYWLTVYQTGLFKWNKKTNTLKEVKENELDKAVQTVVKDHTGNLWFGTRNGLSKLEPKTMTFTHIRYNPNNPKYSPSGNVVTNLCSDGSNLWISVENGGVSRMDIKTGVFTHFMFNKNDPNSLSDNATEALYRDHQNRIWVGTFSSGLCVYDKMKYKFAELNIPLNNDIVNAIWKDEKERIWIGTEGGLTMKKGDRLQQYVHQSTNPKSLPNNPVLSIFEDSNNRLWFGTWDGGLSRYNEQQNNFTNYLPNPGNPRSLSNPNVFSIKEETATHRLLVSSHNGLNVLVNEKLGEFEKHPDLTKQSTSNYLTTLLEDHRGILWTGSINALCRYDLNQHIRTNYLFNEKTGSGTFVNCIIEDNRQTLWIGTNKGLYHMKDDIIIEAFTKLDGLPNDIVRSILIDHHNYLWLSTTSGISKFNPENKSFTTYDVSDGLISNEFKPNASFKSNDGQFFFGGKGVNIFYPDSIKTNPNIPSVFITGLKIFNKNVVIGAADSILHQHVSETNEITLNPEFNFFTIEYVGLNFTASNKNQFAYKLEGFDNDWVQVGTQRFASFTNLDPDTYVFRIKASNNDGLWNEEGASLTIHILPPWWKTWWFRFLLVLGLVSGTILISIFRTRSIRRINRKLADTVDQKTKELQEINSALVQQEEVIKAKNMKLVEQGEELAAQNEELIQSQEEISAQRDLVAQQNENLEEEVTKRTQELVEYNHQLEQFAFISAHNLRAPVARILGLGQVLELVKNNPEEKEQLYPKLISTAKELDGVVKDLNSILELKKNNDSFITDVDLATEISIFRGNMAQEISTTRANITTDFSQVGNICTVKPYLDSILYNLISNAIKYRHPNRVPSIHIKTEKRENEVCLIVTDNGLGIDVERYRDKLFSLYKRFHLHVEGKGMGLYLVKTQLSALGGRIEIESEVNQGTTFRAYFKI